MLADTNTALKHCMEIKQKTAPLCSYDEIFALVQRVVKGCISEPNMQTLLQDVTGHLSVYKLSSPYSGQSCSCSSLFQFPIHKSIVVWETHQSCACG